VKNLHLLDKYRMHQAEIAYYGERGDAGNGIFVVPGLGVGLHVIASNGDGWDHVSVSLPDRVPTYEEMVSVKNMFFKDDETAMQLHVPLAEHINFHPNCLHLWRCQTKDIPRPPEWMVANKKSPAG
jgi:hypothetical protein